MAVLKFMLKIVLLPTLLIVTVIEWSGVFLTSFASVLFYLLAGLSLVLAVFSYLAGICTGIEALRLLAIGFVFFILPHLAAWMIGGIGAIHARISGFIRG